MNYGIAEQEIAERINSMFALLNLSSKFFAAPMPDTDKDVKTFEAQIEKSRVAIEMFDTTFGPDSGLGNVRQEETVTFRLIFEGRKMRGNDGLFAMVNHVINFLLGHKITDGDPLTLFGFGKVQFEPGIWAPYLDFQCKALRSQVYGNEEPALGGPFVGTINTPQQFGGELSEENFE